MVDRGGRIERSFFVAGGWGLEWRGRVDGGEEDWGGLLGCTWGCRLAIYASSNVEKFYDRNGGTLVRFIDISICKPTSTCRRDRCRRANWGGEEGGGGGGSGGTIGSLYIGSEQGMHKLRPGHNLNRSCLRPNSSAELWDII